MPGWMRLSLFKRNRKNHKGTTRRYATIKGKRACKYVQRAYVHQGEKKEDCSRKMRTYR